MPIPSITNYSIKFLSQLANNSDSIIPMAVKDTMSNCAIVHTYKKEGGLDDARERAIEEFGTGAVWLFGIPLVKKILDKTVYPLLKLDPKFDIRLLKDENQLLKTTENLKNSTNTFLQHEKDVFLSLNNKNEVLKNFTNKDLYKGLFVGKFAIATVLSAFALSKLIKYKQKTTNERIENDFKHNNASRILLNNDLKQVRSNSIIFENFLGKKENNEGKEVSFTGAKDIAQLFMFNDIFNTAILDGVITGTRLKEGRKGEKKEILLKELFQIFFIYGVAKPVQLFFEKVGKNLKMPIELDPNVLFSKNLEENVSKASEIIKSNGFIIENVNEMGIVTKALKHNTVDEIFNLANKDINNPLIDILSKNGVISLITDKAGNKQAISSFTNIDSKKVLKTMTNIEEFEKNLSNLKGIKSFKVFSVIANVLFASWAMGVLQPKVNIFMRKVLNDGDNRNPAIVAKENEMHNNNKMSQNII